MITIEYCPEGEPVSDFNFNEWFIKVLGTKGDCVFKVSTTLPIYVIRLAIVKDALLNDDVEFAFGDKRFRANEYGAILDWPRDFANVTSGIAEQIIRTAMAKRKAEKEEKEKA